MPWIVSVHDLVVISRTIDHPAQFVEYLRRRRGRRLATMVAGVDELDMFMWFLNGGMHFPPDPRETAAQLPHDRPIDPGDTLLFEQQAKVRLGTLTDPLGAWFYSQEGLSRQPARKPTRSEEPWVEQYLAEAVASKLPGWLRFGADVVGLSERAQRDIGNVLKRQCRRARRGGEERSFTTHGTTSVGEVVGGCAIGEDRRGQEPRAPYMDAKQYQTDSSRSMLLLFSVDGQFMGSRYRAERLPRSAERDAAVAVAPLMSLQKTFGGGPSAPERGTNRRQGRNSKPERR